MKKMLKCVTAAVLSAAMLLMCMSAAFAGVPVKDFDMKSYVVPAEDTPAYVDFFNTSVNALKTDLPYAKMTYTAGIPENGIMKISDGETEPLNEEANNYLGAIFDGLFSEKNSAFRSLLKTVLGSDSVKNDSFELHRGAIRNNSVPVFGKDYVSALAPAEDYDILVNQKHGEEYPTDIAVVFPETALEDVDKSSLPLVFSLPDGGIDMELIGNADKETQNFLSGIKLSDFRFKDGRVVAKYDKKGALTYYGTVITYNFSFSYFEAVRIMGAVLGIDVYKLVMETMNTILSNLGREDISAEKILLSRRLNVTYTVKTEITDINFAPRYFGDINDDGAVSASDARDALRHAVALERITATEDLLYGDVDFDGEIKSSDARLILRMAVGLDEKFLEVPEGKEIKIVVVEQDRPDEEEQPGEEGGEIEIPEEFKGLFDFDPAISASGFVQFIFDTIGSFEGAEGNIKDDIIGIVDIIRGIVNDSREKNE